MCNFIECLPDTIRHNLSNNLSKYKVNIEIKVDDKARYVIKYYTIKNHNDHVVAYTESRNHIPECARNDVTQ